MEPWKHILVYKHVSFKLCIPVKMSKLFIHFKPRTTCWKKTCAATYGFLFPDPQNFKIKKNTVSNLEKRVKYKDIFKFMVHP